MEETKTDIVEDAQPVKAQQKSKPAAKPKAKRKRNTENLPDIRTQCITCNGENVKGAAILNIQPRPGIKFGGKLVSKITRVRTLCPDCGQHGIFVHRDYE